MNKLTHQLTVVTYNLKRNPTAHKLKLVQLTVKKLMNVAADHDGVRDFNVWSGDIIDWNRMAANDSRWG